MIQRLRFRSLRTKLAFLFLAVGVVPLVVLGFCASRRFTSALMDSAGDDMREQARAAADRIDATLFERYGDVQAFGFHPGARGDRQAVEHTANYFTTNYDYYDLMLVVDLDGTIVGCNTVDRDGKPLDTAGLVGQSVKGEEWFEQIRAGRVPAGQCYFADPAPDKWVTAARAGEGLVMNFSAPVFDEQGQMVRIWSNRASWKLLVSDLLASLRKAKSTEHSQVESQVLSRTGLVLDDLDPQAMLSLNLAEKGLECAAAVAKGQDGFTTELHKRTGKEQVNGYAHSRGYGSFPGNGWGVLLRKETDDVRAEARTFDEFLLVVIGTAAALLVVAGFTIARRIAAPVQLASDALQRVAEGDFTQRIEARSDDELGRMATALNKAVGDIAGAMSEVRATSVALVQAATEVSQTTTQLSDGSQQQASALEETAASLEEITGTVKQNADSARQANQLAAASREVAEKGGKVVADAVLSIKEISKSSEKIANIITTIDEIAFQTNLLALNAAVEAARAGEQGRGFAVVASEVRNLAQRSATSAKEIKALIEESLQKVSAGSELVDRSGKSLEEIVASVKRVTEIIAEIAAASQEQATGVDQVNRAVTQMDQVVQANAGQSTELAQTAMSLSAQAQQLQGLVERFKVDEAHAAPQTRAAPHAPARNAVAPVARAAHAPARHAVPAPLPSRGTHAPQTLRASPLAHRAQATAPAGDTVAATANDNDFIEF